MTQPSRLTLSPPEPLTSSEEGSFSFYTMTERLPNICHKLIQENEFPEEVIGLLTRFSEEVRENKLSLLHHLEAPDFSQWDNYLKPYLGSTWLDVPWFFAETYFYRKILDIIGYFKEGELQNFDPYRSQKRKGLEMALESIYDLSDRLDAIDGDWQPSGCLMLLYFSLWGNRADLSLWSVDDLWSKEADSSEQTEIEKQQERLLIDDTERLVSYLALRYHKRIDIIIDNAGFELVCDLGLVDFLLGSQIADRIYLHLKNYPTFVSDATREDVIQTIDFLAAEQHPELSRFGLHLKNYLNSDRLYLCDDPFWTSPLALWEMPESLYEDLDKSNLVIVKGDANYRRLLGDRNWDLTTQFADILSYFPAPIAALRTLKSEVVVGLSQEQISALDLEGGDWKTNGSRGIIQAAFIPD
ncbi:protein-glutamate O-methyltransferase family protein [Oscillatoriales cyanobacterium LEGE 11467]|uniref:Protein-glutamate O-methyltransferase family protein n=1 Tax=Zarconia navalis LEGE 11467 TaxID=1828826 RepID=A0A928VYE3_9CYAN|nr:damage-control phosphatase ARMT1 family protein [Zarconia navalis]MBE9041909.1 protein-glutamate O-methyltransferase family protein [Zarconia navalis LEGE 11467]